MKTITLSLLSLMTAGFAISPAFASDVMVAATMQRCTTNEECVLVTNSCNDNCGFVPVNKENMTALEGLYQARCNKAMSSNPTCTMNPPMSAACINARCTIDYAYKNNADARDYKPGAYPVPEAPVPSKVPAADYKGVNDTKGFTAYDLPNAEVKQNTVGTIYDRVYVPPSAPVSGGNYVPVGSAPAVPAAPVHPTPMAPPVVAPAPAPMTAPAPAPMAAPAPAPAYVPTPPPAVIPPAAVPTMETHATPAMPSMTPSRPNQVPPGQPGYVPPAPTFVPPPTPMAAPAVPATPTYVPVETMPAGPAVSAVGAPGVPQAPPGSTPIPPSDLQPTPTFVPPTGTAIPVAPEDPGAPPPEGTKIMMKGQPGSEGMVPMDEVYGKNAKSFGATSAPKGNKTGSTNE